MTQKARTALQSDINANINDNSSGDITAADVRITLTDINDSFYNKSTDTNISLGELCFSIDGGGEVVETSAKSDLRVPYNCTITGWEIVVEPSGSIEFDVWKKNYASFPPDSMDSITASAKPSVVSNIKGQHVNLAGWSVNLTEGEYLRFAVNSVTDVKKALLTLKVVRA